MIHGVFWQFAGTGAEMLAKIVSMVVLARLLTPYEFGIAGSAMIVVTVLEAVSKMGIGPALTQKASLSDSEIRVAFLFVMVSGIMVFLLTRAAASDIALIFRLPELTGVLLIASFAFLAHAPGVVPEGLLIRHMKFRQVAVAESVSFALGYAPTAIILALLDFGYWSLIYAYLAQVVFRTIMMTLLSPHARLGAIRPGEIFPLLRFGTGFAFAQTANFLAGQADYFVVTRWLGANALGFYGRSFQFIMIPVQLVGRVADRVLFSAMSRMQDDFQRLGRAYVEANGTIMFIATHIGAAIVIVAPELVRVVLGHQWIASILPLQILAAAMAFRTCSKLSDSVARAVGAVYRRAVLQWLFALLVLTFAYIGHFWGIAGVAAGASLAFAANFALMLDLTARLIGVSRLTVAGLVVRQTATVLPFAAVVLGAALYGRHAGLGDLLTLVISLAAGAVVVGAILLLAPRFYGTETERSLATLVPHFKKIRAKDTSQ